MGGFDYWLERLVNRPAGTHPAWDAIFVTVAVLAEPLFIALVTVWFACGVWRHSSADRVGAIAALIGSGVVLLVNAPIASVYNRPRPFIAHPATVHLLVAHSTDASFPSDHASAGFAIASSLFLVHRRWGTATILFGLLMCYARVYIGDHYAGDVVAGLIVGSTVGVLTRPIARRPLAHLERVAVNTLACRPRVATRRAGPALGRWPGARSHPYQLRAVESDNS